MKKKFSILIKKDEIKIRKKSARPVQIHLDKKTKYIRKNNNIEE